jgi:hypothetical protein
LLALPSLKEIVSKQSLRNTLLSQSNVRAPTSGLTINLTTTNDKHHKYTNTITTTMARRTRSKKSASSNRTDNVDIKVEETPEGKIENTEVDIDLGCMDEVPDMSATPTNKQGEEVVAKTESVIPAAPATEYEEDLIDYDDDELLPAVDSGIGSDDTPIDFEDDDIKLEDDIAIKHSTEQVTAEEQAEIEATKRVVAEEALVQAKYIMSLGPQTLLTQSDMAGALQLNRVGDTVVVNIAVNGVKYEISWKVTGFEEHEPDPQNVIEQCAALATTQEPTALTVDTTQRKPSSSLRDAAPLSGSTPKAAHFTATKCKFGKFCTKGTACPFDHTIKSKLCTWVNTTMGCAKGLKCEFSHDNEGTKCTRGPSRFTCANGKGCAFKHDDDVRKALAPAPVPKPKLVASPAPTPAPQQIEVVDSTPPANVPKGHKAAISSLANVPTGPKAKGTATQLGQGAGQKRGRGEDDEGDNAVQRQKVSHDHDNNNGHRAVRQHRGRSRGNVRGRGRGRGRGGAGVGAGTGGFSIKGAAGAQ